MKRKVMLSVAQYYPTALLMVILCGSVFLSFTPYWLNLITLYDNKRFFVIFYLLMTAIVIIVSHPIRQKIIQPFIYLPFYTKLLIFTALFTSFIANFFSLYWIKSQAVYTYALLFIITIPLLYSVVLEKKTLILKSYIWLTCAIFTSVLLYHWIATYHGLTPNYRYIFSFVNPRNINYMQIWLILPLLYFAWQKRTHPRAWIYTIPVIMHFSLLIALDARGAFISAISGIALWVFLSTEKLIKLKFVVVLLVFGVLIKLLIFTPLPQFWFLGIWPEGQGEIRVSDSNRLNLWSNAIAMISFWGHGGDTFVCNNDDIAHSPHNSVLLMTVEWGVITSLCYISLLMTIFYRVCITKDENLRILGITVLSGFAYSLISSVVNSPLSQGLAVVSIALYWATTYQTEQQLTEKTMTPIASKVAHFLLIFLACWALIFIGYKTYQRIDNNQYRHMNINYYKPQFWIEQNCMDGEPKLNIP